MRTSATNAFRPAELRGRLQPFRLYFYTRVRSTNDHAASLRRAHKLYAPAVVVAASQTAGRGRGSNSWWSGKGSLTVTFCLPVDDRLPPHHVPLLAGWAVRDAITHALPVPGVEMKWPNDLWHRDLKLAGLLCERLDGVDLVGIGLNVNVVPADIPVSLRPRVTGLAAVAGRTFDLNDVLAAVAGGIDRWLLRRTAGTFEAMRTQYDGVHALTGRVIAVTEPGNPVPSRGVCDGLDAEGRLLLRDGTRVVRVVAGRVDLL